MFVLMAFCLMLLLASGVRADETPGGQGGSQDGGSKDGTGGTQGGSGGGMTVEEALKQVREANNEAKNLRQAKKDSEAKLSEITAELEKYKNASLTNEQKLQAQVDAFTKDLAAKDQMLTTLQQQNLKHVAERAFAKAAPDAVDPDLMIDKLSLAEVLDDKGALDAKKLADQIANLRKLYPRQFTGSTQGRDAGAGGTGGAVGPNAAMNRAIRQAAGRA